MAKLLNAESEEVIFENLIIADNFWRRAVGLIGKASLSADQAILIRPCNSVHTCFMRMELGVAFCDSEGQVLQVATGVRPWRFRFGPRKSRFVVEWSTASPRLRVGQKIRVD
ncbi:MAG: DUF192 domain-containing protein [Rubripirellula sp.]